MEPRQVLMGALLLCAGCGGAQQQSPNMLATSPEFSAALAAYRQKAGVNVPCQFNPIASLPLQRVEGGWHFDCTYTHSETGKMVGQRCTGDIDLINQRRADEGGFEVVDQTNRGQISEGEGSIAMSGIGGSNPRFTLWITNHATGAGCELDSLAAFEQYEPDAARTNWK